MVITFRNSSTDKAVLKQHYRLGDFQMRVEGTILMRGEILKILCYGMQVLSVFVLVPSGFPEV